MAETVHQEPTTPAAEGQQPERTFTQAEMNAIISDRLSRERSKYADYDDLKAKAQQFDAAQEAGKTELQKANEKAAKLQEQLDTLTKATPCGSSAARWRPPPACLPNCFPATPRRAAPHKRRPSSSLQSPATPTSGTAVTLTTPPPAPPVSSLPTGSSR